MKYESNLSKGGRYKIGSSGLVPIDSGKLKIQASTIYPMGASSHPEPVFVTRVDKDTIYYKSYPFARNKERRIESWIGKDLISTGLTNEIRNTSEALKGPFAQKWMQDKVDRYKNMLAGNVVKVDRLSDYDEFEATVIASDGGDVKKLWRDADAYGSPGIRTVNGKDVMTIDLNRAELKELKNDSNFKIISTKVTAQSEESKKESNKVNKKTGKGGPYIGPRGGKWADPQHKIPWTEKGMKYEISLNKSAARGGKYKRRIPKPGGGYRYIYGDEDVSDQKIGEALSEKTTKDPMLSTSPLKEWRKYSDEGRKLENQITNILGSREKMFSKIKELHKNNPKLEDAYIEQIRVERDSSASDTDFFRLRNKYQNMLNNEMAKFINARKSLPDTDLQKAVWPTSHKNDLPDSAFLYIEPGGKKDEEGKTKPRSLRHFPYKNIQGKVDQAHVRNAIARIPQSKCGLSASQKEALQNRARKYLKGDTEKAMDYYIDLEKSGNNNMEKGAIGGKYTRRIPKPGGGYRYEYDEPTGKKAVSSEGKTLSNVLSELGYTHESVGGTLGKRRIKKDGKIIITGNSQEIWTWLHNTKQIKGSSVSSLEYGSGKTMSRGSIRNNDGTYTAMTYSQSKNFKTKKGADKWLASRGLNPDGTKKSISDSDLEKSDYHSSQFKKVKTSDEYGHSVQVRSDKGYTKHLTVSPDVVSALHSLVSGKQANTKDSYINNEVNKIVNPDDKANGTYAIRVHSTNGHTNWMNIDKGVINKLDKHILGTKKKQQKGPYIGPKGGKYADPEHKIAWSEKSIGDNNMNEFKELNDFIKSTIEDEAQASINESKKNGEGQSLAGKGKNGGSPSATGSAPNLGATKPPVKKLSEDDEVDEKNMKPHKKPLEQSTRKSLPVSAQKEQIAYELKKAEQEATRVDDVTPDIGKVMCKAEEPVIKSSDEMAAELAKADGFYYGGNPKMNWNSPLTTSHVCPNCEGSFMKALTVCPHCGK